MSTRLPVILFSGSVGAGKTAVAGAAHDILCDLQIPNAFVDVDCLTCCWPETGPYNEQLVLDSLAVLWPLYRNAGARRLVLARVIETSETLQAYVDALDGADIKLVRVTASESTRRARLQSREMGASREWHLARTTELQKILEDAALEDYLVENETAAPEVAARAALRLCDWIQ